MFHMTRATAPGHRRRGEVRQRSVQRRGAVAGIRGASGDELRADTIPCADAQAGPVRGPVVEPESNATRTLCGSVQCPFEPGPAIVRPYPAALLRKWSMVMRMASCLRRGRLSIRSSRSSTLRVGLGCWTITGGVLVCSKS